MIAEVTSIAVRISSYIKNTLVHVSFNTFVNRQFIIFGLTISEFDLLALEPLKADIALKKAYKSKEKKENGNCKKQI
jgi:hypothetical protein